VELPVRNLYGRGKAGEYLDAKLVSIVGDRFAAEIARFVYAPPAHG
jgi:hypothetical protein